MNVYIAVGSVLKFLPKTPTNARGSSTERAVCEQARLPNRQLQNELRYAIARGAGRRRPLRDLADLDGFREVNDGGGHDAGDRLLRDVAQRLQQGLRQGDLVARVGGDELVALLPGCRNAETTRADADGLRAHLSPSYTLSEGLFGLDASIGIARFPADGSDAGAVLAHADLAMYAAKRER